MIFRSILSLCLIESEVVSEVSQNRKLPSVDNWFQEVGKGSDQGDEDNFGVVWLLLYAIFTWWEEFAETSIKKYGVLKTSTGHTCLSTTQ